MTNDEEAIEEIKAILKKRDLAGVAYVCAADHAAFVHVFEPSWSCVRIEGDQLRIRSKRADYPTKDEQRRVLSATVGLFLSLHARANETITMVGRIIEMLARNIPDIRHWEKREDGYPS